MVSEIYSANLRAAKPRLRALSNFYQVRKKSLRTVTEHSRSANRTRLSVGNLLLPPYRRLRSLTAASVPPFPPFGRRSLRFESALANIYCFKIKKTLFAKRVSFFGDNRTRLSVGNFLLPPYRPAPVADGGVPAAFSSLWSALPALRVRFS